MYGGVGGRSCEAPSYPDVCRARHVILRVSRAYHENGRSASPRPSQAVAKGVAVVQGDFPLARGVPGGSRPAKVGYRERMGRRTEIELGGSGGTNPRHRTKSPNCLIGQARILGARVRKDTCLPREISYVVLDRRVRGKLTGGPSNRPRTHRRSQQRAY